MAWSYRKRIKIIPGVHLNLSKSGISTSIGVRGASLTLGRNGTYLNTGIPGTGLSNRVRLGTGNTNNTAPAYNDPQPVQGQDNIFSADIQEITSQDMQGIKEAIIAAHEQRKELKTDLLKIRASLGSSKLKLAASYILLYGLVKKAIPQTIKADIRSKKSAISQVTEQIDACYVGLNIEFDPVIKEKYDRVVQSFKALAASQKIWDVTSEHYQDRKQTRSAASTVINKREVKFGIKSLPDVKSEMETLWLKNANGADLYFYPHFIVMYSTQKSFAIVGLAEINFNQLPVRFLETGTIPADSKVIDKTWAKVNKNGTPDKRFKDNRQIPIVRYGEISLRTATGLHEEYHFSNYEASEEFAAAFREYQQLISTLKPLEAQMASLDN